MGEAPYSDVGFFRFFNKLQPFQQFLHFLRPLFLSFYQK